MTSPTGSIDSRVVCSLAPAVSDRYRAEREGGERLLVVRNVADEVRAEARVRRLDVLEAMFLIARVPVFSAWQNVMLGPPRGAQNGAPRGAPLAVSRWIFSWRPPTVSLPSTSKAVTPCAQPIAAGCWRPTTRSPMRDSLRSQTLRCGSTRGRSANFRWPIFCSVSYRVLRSRHDTRFNRIAPATAHD